ncbi:hypothetical protein M8C21_010463 [Ambrosia artemisiifolia]|uniref:Uncharacterized protein n=1 Tax=Ambrosia artemisiifolia TaxID=4212 RepID=A0AAD5GMJ8_AMBAR|nr:hypothetical protein M8C21_010463 [Ambrosia artemisiifolia]
MSTSSHEDDDILPGESQDPYEDEEDLDEVLLDKKFDNIKQSVAESSNRKKDNRKEKLETNKHLPHLKQKINSMFNGDHINNTENRFVLHVALRAAKDTTMNSDGKDVVPGVWQVLDKIREFRIKFAMDLG